MKYTFKLLFILELALLINCGCKKETETKITDADGNLYTSVKIGDQEWLVENLRTTRLTDGTVLQNVTGKTEWANLVTPAFCLYNNDDDNKNDYGALYNYAAVASGKLCPKGWHVPSDEEWTALTDFLGGESNAGDKMKETGTSHWNNTSVNVTNSSGITALPGGYRDYQGEFDRLGDIAYWWTSTENSSSEAWYRSIFQNDDEVYFSWVNKNFGYSVRCLRD